MKIALVSANTFTEPYPVYPLGLDYVAGSLVEDHDVDIIDMNCLGSPEEIAGPLRAVGPDLVGLSLRNIDNTDAAGSLGFIDRYRAIASIIRAAVPAPLVLGGSGFTLFPGELLGELGAEYGIIGEGERMALLARAIGNGSGTGDIPGVVTAGNTVPPPRPWDGSPRRTFNPSSPHVDFYLKKGGMLNLQTKRGCPYRCIYCTYPRIEGNAVRLFPPNEVAETALMLQKAGARYLFVTDSVFNCNTGHCQEVAEAFIRNGVTVPWGAYFTPVRPPGGFFRLMRRAGLTHAEFGTESLCGPMLESYGKPFSPDDVAAAHEAAVTEGVHAAHFMLMGGPGEDASTVARTLDAADALKKAVVFFFCGVRIYPGTGLHEIALREGQIIEGQSLLSPVFYRSGNIGTDEIISMVKARAVGRPNWVFGSGGDTIVKTLRRMYRRGFTGPLWEFLVQ